MNRMNKYIVATGLFLFVSQPADSIVEWAYRMKSGDTLAEIIASSGLGRKSCQNLVSLLEDSMDVRKCYPGDEIKIKRVGDRLVEFEFIGKGVVYKVDSLYNFKRQGKKLILGKGKPKTEKEEEKPFSYSAGGKRDPFKPLIGWAPKEDTLLDVRDARVVGIIWSPEEKYALIQAADGKIYTVEEGDRVKDGKVSTIGKKEVIFTLWELGRTKRLTLGIKEKE